MCNPDQEHEGDEDSFFFFFFSPINELSKRSRWAGMS